MKTSLNTLALFAMLLLPAITQAQDNAPNAAQIQLRKAAEEAYQNQDHQKAVDLLQGYLQLGEFQVGYLELARAYMHLEECELALKALQSAKKAPRASDLDPQAYQKTAQTIRDKVTLQCDTSAQAETLYKLALRLFQDRQWLPAAEAFEKALEQDPNPTLAYNAGRSYEYAGVLSKASEYYLKTLSLNPDPSLRDKVQKTLERLQNIQNALGQKDKPGLLDLSTSPTGALVRVDGKIVGETPLKTAWKAGSMRLNLSLDGYHEVERSVQLDPGKEFVLQTTLEPQGEVFTWISLGSSVAFLGGGIAFGLLAQDKLDESKTADAIRNGSFENLKSDGQTYAWLSVGSYTLSAVSLISALAFHFSGNESNPTEPPSAWWWAVGPEHIGVQGQF